ncbi:yippee zinc-binding/DNA-binding /Mis18, centromere assembly-domain-containing protein [Mycotypha africana]|uniref:yippee zinc-binding/DNA-binding /Mis18, centromere assembly-domain-containing protein n=1 Tax=Mycotypha africana TaxID=64632 RepID=UPI0023000816|nr:yippee zinc-binding/DNA-binding /Mis18, centromere assembly-domain-containing protein [Mycotypha africana]KAI8971408.1 yippee zinc-binding/DNA-binding /Mis18, centromere assembly-domain-containing protein [Mycotypha africana]
MGLKYRVYLEGNCTVYGCIKCGTHLAMSEAIMSKQFQGQHGQAYLFDEVVNISFGKAEDREMSTGLHRVRDIHCIQCASLLGWTYVKAYDNDNRYKEGKFILERKLLRDLAMAKVHPKSRK